jgi:ABC-type Fe3+/spermidine/putrescine transport system ATPase subunit
MLELMNVSKRYEGKPLLTDISFTVRAGETICLLGASGSGKSTLLRIIAGLESPESGQVSFSGVDLAHTPPHARDFGLVFQDYGLFPHLNVFDNIAFGLKMRNLPAAGIRQRVAGLMEQVGLAGFEKRKVTDLSGGEQQRVALARALAIQPRLLMFDEPLGALDRTLKEDLLDELRDILHRTNIPAIYVTHDQEEAFAIADRILLLHDGAILREGAPEEVWKDPGSAWAARFLAAGNVIDGIVDVNGRVKTQVGEFKMTCHHNHAEGEKVSLLLKQFPFPKGGGTRGGGLHEIKLKVEDVLFQRDQFQVRGGGVAPSSSRGGIVIHMEERPKIGQVVTVRVEVECLP